jgi:hypothetical protein
MNFTIPTNATTEEVEAIIARGIDAMFEDAEAGGNGDVAFLHEGSVEAEEAKKRDETIATTEDETKSDIADDDERNNVDTIEDPCPECGEDPCVFGQHEELLVLFDDTEHGTGSTEPIPTNNVRRKKLYRQLTLMLNGGPLGAGVRRPLPNCCVSAIRDMLPSESFMGFKAE